MEMQAAKNFSTIASVTVEVGKLYKHYTGKIYKILSIAHYSENPESLMVVYQGLYNCPTFGKNPIWCRPYTMFTEVIEINGKFQPRFSEVSGAWSEEIYHHGIKFIIKNELNQILILKTQYKTWDLPGGRVQMNEFCEDTGKREVQEETGITTLDNIEYVGSFPAKIRIKLNQQQMCGLIYSFYRANTTTHHVLLSDEHEEYKWVPLEDAMNYLQDFFGTNIQKIVDKLCSITPEVI